MPCVVECFRRGELIAKSPVSGDSADGNVSPEMKSRALTDLVRQRGDFVRIVDIATGAKIWSARAS